MVQLHLGFPSPSIADLDMRDNASLARLSEEAGFDTLWHSNQRFYREMFIRMASSAMATSHIGLGGAVSEPFAVHPILTAQSIATVSELSNGRATLAMGAGGSGFQMMGLKRERSALALEEALAVVKPLLAGEEVTYEGEIVKAYGAHLQFKPQHPITLWVATRGSLTLKMSGAHADAVMLATYATPAGVRHALSLVEEGAKQASRSLDDLRVMSRVDTCVHLDRRKAYDGTRIMIARFLWSSYPDRDFVRQTGLDVPDNVETLIAKRDYSLVPQAAKMIPDEFIESFCWAGTPEVVADRIINIAQATGINEFGLWVLLAPGQTREEAIQLLATDVLPAIREVLD